MVSSTWSGSPRARSAPSRGARSSPKEWGTAALFVKALIHEEFGDGIMSAIDFNMDLTHEPDPRGDRVKIVMSGKFLPYKAY
jgi:hypothetical protein